MIGILSQTFTIATRADAPADPRRGPGWIAEAAGGLAAAVDRRLRAARARRHLAALDDRLLDDIGVRRAEIDRIVATGAAEAAERRPRKPFRAPVA